MGPQTITLDKLNDDYVGTVRVGRSYGVFTCTNGNVYTGEFRGIKFHGVGMMTWPDGYVYKGNAACHDACYSYIML